MIKEKHILFIGTVWPEPVSSAAGSRTLQLIELFLKNQWKVSFASTAAESEFSFDLEKTGVKKFSIELNNESFDTFIKELQPDIVVFDRFMIEEQFGWRVAENCTDAVRILDTIDLHCLRNARQNAFKEKRSMMPEDLHSDLGKREVASILRSDLSLMISTVEMDLLKNYFRIDHSLLHYVPFLFEPVNENNIAEGLSFEERNHFITIGNFIHEPNWNAVQFLKEEIWPLIRKKLPEAELHVYGAYPSQKVLQLNQPKDGFLIKGRAPDANDVVKKAKVVLAPLRFGAGIKGKLVEAMQCGTPSVTTDIGAESMHGDLEWSGIIANNAEDIAIAAIKLYSDKNLWEASQKNGVKIIREVYSKDLHGKKLIERITGLELTLKHHRLNNFLGEMLMHHTISGTKYMSKWIEAKNKLG